jgi:hypothetical protein
VSDAPLLLNHAEMIYRPGEAEHAKALFETIGFGVSRWESWLHIHIDPVNSNGMDNVMYANQATPAQQSYEEAFVQALADDSRLAQTFQRNRELARAWPYYNFHFGAAIPTYADWQERVERLQEANRSHPLLKDRVELIVIEPSTPRALSALSQAFVFTDILTSGGPFVQGLQFEIQWRPGPESGEETTLEWLTAAGPGNPFPDPSELA